MGFVDEPDSSYDSSDSENLPATPRAKRKLAVEGSKGKIHSKKNKLTRE